MAIRYNSLAHGFWAHVTKLSEKECWEWQGSRQTRGYGRLKYKGVKYSAHRLSYILHFNEIPHNLYVCHTCDNPPCVNPSHLFLGTNSDNQKDLVAKNLHNPTIGEMNGCAKLTEKQVLEIYALRGKMFQFEIAKIYGVTKGAISLIHQRERWRHILPPPQEKCD